MGCFSVLRPKKRRSIHALNKRPSNSNETPPVRLPEPEPAVPSLQSAPPSFRNRARNSSQPSFSSRSRTLSAPSSLVLADQYTISPASFYDQDDLKSKIAMKDEHRYSNALPLPLPSPEDSGSPPALKNWGSFKTTSNVSGPLVSVPLDFSGPLPLPPSSGNGLRNFSYEEVSAACQHFSTDRCTSEGINMTMYKATFGDELVATKKIEATVTRVLTSSLVKSLHKNNFIRKSYCNRVCQCRETICSLPKISRDAKPLLFPTIYKKKQWGRRVHKVSVLIFFFICFYGYC
jgi:hypothetical protein